ncbi:MFS transporter [Pseudonocardia sp. CA-107938]|uniref:MFS transporter n=1 Tax=Pseudonocardia sp. CA-107938 TaxID=3240021 RepID=UPI003D92F6D1
MTKRSRAVREPVLGLQVVVLVDLLGLTLMLPALPFHVLDLGGGGTGLGAVLASFSLAQFVAAPLWGRWSDRAGRRPLLLLSLAGSCLSLAAMALAPSVGWLVVARLLAGACGGSIGVAHALAADLTSVDRRTAAMGRLGMSVGAAFTVGPLLGALLAGAGFAAVAAAGAGLAALAFVLAWSTIPRTPVERADHAEPAARGTGRVWPLVVAVAAGMLALVGLESSVGLLAGTWFAAGPRFVGVVLAAAGLTMTVVQARPLVVAAARWGERRVALAAAACMVTGLALLPLTEPIAFAVVVAVVAASQGVLATACTSLLSRMSTTPRGRVMGRAQSGAAAARAIGPVLVGAGFDVTATAPVWIAASAAAAAGAAVALSAAPVEPDARLARG